MNERACLESHLREHPEDWNSWLVYADWLTDAGDDRGKLITLRHRLQAGTSGPREYDIQLQQATLLEGKYDQQWRSRGVVSEDITLYLRHGFLIGVWPSWDKGTLQTLAEIESQPEVQFFTYLNLSSRNLRPKDIYTLADSKTLRRITWLTLWDNDIQDEGVRTLVSSQNLSSLTTLYLDNNNISAEGVRALASSETLCGLTTLTLSENNIGNEGASIIAASKTLCSLTNLDLSRNNIGNKGAFALATSESLDGLSYLNLSNNHIGDEGAKALRTSKYLSKCSIHT